MIMEAQARRRFITRYVKAYISIFAVIAVVVAISELRGVGWRPALAGIPMYASLFVLVTYAMLRELRQIRKSNKTDEGEN
ncbi:hypothetical protein LMG27177_01713 [Paraburkholderia fynbosensis]|uniref:Transmembrane protein n=1 Tax=Paraburkholderia fynbosensis TaxID=1200993 RepID=A0A6J5FT95_9BURK|nr:hypothetical protein LMG27177_01713 [Paraburkholderia fynbosensis]